MIVKTNFLLSFLSAHILRLTEAYSRPRAAFSSYVDRELCDRESDMPWGIQMCMVGPIILSISIASQLHLLASFTHAATAYCPFSTG